MGQGCHVTMHSGQLPPIPVKNVNGSVHPLLMGGGGWGECTPHMCLGLLARDRIKDIDYNDPQCIYNLKEFEPDITSNCLERLNKSLTPCGAWTSWLYALVDMYMACFVSGVNSGLHPIPS